VVYYKLGREDEAMKSFKRAVELDPYFAEGYSNLSATYYHRKQHKKAIECYKKAEALGFNNPALYELLKPYLERQ
jgi:tetratricopeptide (TPR) repeat protein